MNSLIRISIPYLSQVLASTNANGEPHVEKYYVASLKCRFRLKLHEQPENLLRFTRDKPKHVIVALSKKQWYSDILYKFI